ncbi:MAG: cyclase family protein [Candidatus Sumerlaeia bacterium]|nr:cyclase family protein [Candidatus Sumerlaeia bacterium]
MLRVIDLSLTLRAGMRGIGWETSHAVDRDGWNARLLHLYSHGGTHIDAPRHYLAGGETIENIPLERCIVPAWVANLQGLGPRTLITVEHVQSLGDCIQPGDGLLLRTGWSARIDEPTYRTHAPRVSLELARWCVERKLSLLGVEPPALADVQNIAELSAVHRVLLEAGILVVEGLTNLEAIGSGKVWFVAAPLKISGGDGSPVRAFAIEGLPDCLAASALKEKGHS